jgi:tetratricopeptide (TPR) repeat protein
LLDAALAEAPHAVLLHTVLRNLLLKEAQDWDAAELALRRILELDPHHEEARRNLDLLCRRQGRSDAIALLDQRLQALVAPARS